MSPAERYLDGWDLQAEVNFVIDMILEAGSVRLW